MTSKSALHSLKILQISGEGYTIRCYVRPASDDAKIVYEVMSNPYYQDARSLLDEGAVVIDIGAHIGAFTLSCAALGARVLALEPLPENYDLLTANVHLNGFQAQVKTLRAAAWSSAGEHPLRIAGDSTGGSGFYYGREKAVEIVVPCIRLDEWMNDEGVTCCNLLKLDCEGAEFEILNVLSQSFWQRIQAIVMEYHLFGGYSTAQLQSLIASQGFAVMIQPTEEVGGVIGLLLAVRPTSFSPLILSPLQISQADSPLTRLPVVGSLWRALRRPIHGLVVYYLNQLVAAYNRQSRRTSIYLRMLNQAKQQPDV